MKNLVIMKNRQAVTTSLQVADNFEKRHSDVLENIKILVAENSVAKFFLEDTYENRGKEYPMYYMNRDGFTILAMGFTGKKALQFKLKYIEAFNKMENHIKSTQSKRIDSDLEDIKRMNATARLENAKVRKAKLYVELAKDAKTDVNKALLQDKAVEVLDGKKMLEMPALRRPLFDSDEIAGKIGVFSQKGKPHGTAVSQLIKKKILVSDDEFEIFPEATNHWSGPVTKYAESVIEKVKTWLEQNNYPTKIEGYKMNYHVQYKF